jgi:hypothetical protein
MGGSMNKEFQQMLGWIVTLWGGVWGSVSTVLDRPLSWWVSVLTIIALIGNIRNQWSRRRGVEGENERSGI